MKKGIFWCTDSDTEAPALITVSVACDKNGDSKELVRFSSKSGNNFNHRLEWERFDRNITAGRPFNYYPRGRVEIKKRKVTVFLNPAINKECMKKINIGIKKAMGLWVDKPYRKPTDIRCLCVKCLEDYKNNPNFIVKRLDPFARVKEKCDKCQNLGYDYLVIERSKEGR